MPEETGADRAGLDAPGGDPTSDPGPGQVQGDRTSAGGPNREASPSTATPSPDSRGRGGRSLSAHSSAATASGSAFPSAPSAAAAQRAYASAALSSSSPSSRATWCRIPCSRVSLEAIRTSSDPGTTNVRAFDVGPPVGVDGSEQDPGAQPTAEMQQHVRMLLDETPHEVADQAGSVPCRVGVGPERRRPRSGLRAGRAPPEGHPLPRTEPPYAGVQRPEPRLATEHRLHPDPGVVEAQTPKGTECAGRRRDRRPVPPLGRVGRAGAQPVDRGRQLAARRRPADRWCQRRQYLGGLWLLLSALHHRGRGPHWTNQELRSSSTTRPSRPRARCSARRRPSSARSADTAAYPPQANPVIGRRRPGAGHAPRRRSPGSDQPGPSSCASLRTPAEPLPGADREAPPGARP